MEAICPVPCLQFRISAFLRNFVPSGAAHEAAAGHALSEPSETHHHHIEYKKPTLLGRLLNCIISISVPSSERACVSARIFGIGCRKPGFSSPEIRRRSPSSAPLLKEDCWQDGSLRNGKSPVSPIPCPGQCSRLNNSREHPSRTKCRLRP